MVSWDSISVFCHGHLQIIRTSYCLLWPILTPFFTLFTWPHFGRERWPPPRDRHDLQYTRIWAGHVATRLTLHPGRGVPATVVFVYGNSHPLFSFFFSTPQEAWEAKACTVFVNNGTRIKHHHEVVEVFFFFKWIAFSDFNNYGISHRSPPPSTLHPPPLTASHCYFSLLIRNHPVIFLWSPACHWSLLFPVFCVWWVFCGPPWFVDASLWTLSGERGRR